MIFSPYGRHSEQGTPTTVFGSASPSSGGGNLTGVARKVRDNCAELHNSVERWNTLQVEGSRKLREIVDLRERRMQEADDEDDKVDSLARRAFSPQLQELCAHLLNIIEQMRTIHEKMEVLAHQFDSLVALADIQSNFEQLVRSPAASPVTPQSPTVAQTAAAAKAVVFHTWTLNDFARTTRSVADAYALDLRLKSEIAESVGHVAKPIARNGLFLLTAWLHQPHVADKIAVQLEAMVVECRLRR